MKTTSLLNRIFLFGVVIALAACSDDDVTCPSNHDSQPIGTPTDMAQRIARTNDFAVDLYNEIKTDEGNIIVSPHSITTNFGMVYAGARGVTEKEIAQVLHFNYPPVDFHTVLKELNDLLQSRGGTVDPQHFHLKIASSAWGRDDFSYLQSYLDTLSVYYGAGMQFLDFAGQPELARLTINQWVENETDGLIQDLLQPGSINPLTVLVLANAIYFRGSWLHQFDPRVTGPREFNRLDGSTVTVQMMSVERSFDYHDGNGYEAIALPYEGEECSMLLILPDEGNFESFEASFTPAGLDAIVSELHRTYLLVHLPKFSFVTRYQLKSCLEAMGMETAFNPSANFSGINGVGGLWIDWVAHKAFISVDEYGTLAAAATATGFTVGIPPVFDANRPFIFVIRDDETGTILFVGRVVDPSA
jgi:serpin B